MRSICLSIDELADDLVRPVIGLGFFDGVHMGHQAILDIVREKARRFEGTSTVLTFKEHPSRIVAPETAPKLLTTLSERVGLLANSGINAVLLADFTSKFAAQPPEEFVRRVLVEKLKVREVVAGYNYRFGCQGRGNMESMRRLGETYGFEVTTVGPIEKEGRIVSSTLIRSLLLSGEVERAAELLTRPYEFVGTVIDGEKRARVLGFPTANLKVAPEKLVPAEGVYAVKVRFACDCSDKEKLEKSTRAGVLSISSKPTFGGKARAIEVHVLDMTGDFYGKKLQVEFVTRLRSILRFDRPEMLTEQVKHDIQKTRSLLGPS